MTRKRLNEWVSWSMRQLESRRVDPFLQGWRCAYAMIMAFDEIPADVRKKISEAVNEAESVLWKRAKKKGAV